MKPCSDLKGTLTLKRNQDTLFSVFIKSPAVIFSCKSLNICYVVLKLEIKLLKLCLILHSHLFFDAPQIYCSVSSATAKIFLYFFRLHIMENMEDVERVAWVYMLWRALQRAQSVWVHQILNQFEHKPERRKVNRGVSF